MLKLILAVGAAALVTVGVTGCAGVVENVAERAIEAETGEKADVNIDKDGASIETKDGTYSVGTGELPASFPEDVPVPDDVTVVAGAGGTTGGSGASLTTKDSAADVAKFYEDELPANGWVVDQDASTSIEGVGTNIIVASKDNRSLSVSIQAGQGTGETAIFIGVTEQ